MTVLAHPCIGGPLDGEYADVQDFLGGTRFLGDTRKGSGKYGDLAGEYTPYEWVVLNKSVAPGDFPPKRVYLHQSVLKPTLNASDR